MKLGTNLLTSGRDSLDLPTVSGLVDQIVKVRQHGIEALVVTSGAVALGRETLVGGGRSGRVNRRALAYRQALAAIGQARLMQLYERLFDDHGVPVAQALVTRGDLQRRAGYLNFRNTLETLIAIDALPIINENDVVAVDELKADSYGDNDRLSAMVANAVDADLLILLGEMEGLFTRDPAVDPDAQIISQVDEIDDYVAAAAGESRDGRGRGGMASKVQAAKLATASGTEVVIASGRTPQAITRLCNGENLGTRFVSGVSRVESRKRWILTGVSEHRGGVVADKGAATAVREVGKSLLAAGIIEVEGAFQRGDIVAIKTDDGKVFAWGIANYSSRDLHVIKGRRSGSVMDLLGREYGPEVVHRDNMTVL